MRTAGLGELALAVVAMFTLVHACSKPNEAAPRSTASASITAASAPRSAAPSAFPPMTPTGSVSSDASYMVSLTSDGCALELRINDVPLRQVEAGRRTDYGEIVDVWLRAGVNSLTLESKGKFAKGCVSLDVLAIPKDGDQRTAPRVLQASWPPDDSAGSLQVFEFHGPVADRCQLWRDAEPIRVTPADRVDLLEQVRALHRSFARRDIEALAGSTKYRAEDVARCTGKSPASGVDDQKRFFSAITSDASFSALPLDEAAVLVDVVAHDRLVWLHRPGDKLLLQNNLTQGMDLYAAKIAGRWTIVR